MPTAMVVNPARKRRKKRARTKGGRYKKTTRRRNPIAAIAAANPKRRRRRGRSKSRTYRRRRNPAGFNLQAFATKRLMPALIGGAGGLGLDIIMAQLPIPENLKTGPMAPLVKGIGAIGMGMVAGMVVGRQTAEQVLSGALTVVAYGALKDFVATSMPNIQLSAVPMVEAEYNALEYYSPSQMVDGVYDEPLGAYLDEDYDAAAYEVDESFGGSYDEPLGAYLDDDTYRMRNGQEDLYL